MSRFSKTTAVALLVTSCVAIVCSGCQDASTRDAQAATKSDSSSPDATLKKSTDSKGASTEKTNPVATGATLDLNFDHLKFEMKKEEPFQREMLTEQIEAYKGRSIRIRGYMLNSPIQNGIRGFTMVRDNMECCFGPGAALFDSIQIRLKPGTTTSYKLNPITVEGTFTIDEVKMPGGKHVSLYRMDNAAMR